MTQPSPRLDAVFVQYDRGKYPGAFERFLAVLEGVAVEYRLVVVDNKKEGGWFHPLSARVFHIGGDNEAWEFSAFDRGREFLDATRGDGSTWPGPADLWVFGTDAFTAYGDEYLELLSADAIRFCLETQGAVGWVDSFMEPLSALGLRYQDWLRTSFLLLPDAVLRDLGDLCTPLDTQSLFTSSPERPFHDQAPISEELRQNLIEWLTTAPGEGELDETWHSRFELSAETTEFFAHKASAILREHLLSARLQAADVPAFDLRLVQELKRRGLNAGSLDRKARKKAAWNGWRSATASPRFNLDDVSLPDRMRHGDAGRIHVSGWAVPARNDKGGHSFSEIEIYIGEETFRSRCDLLRPDVLKALPQLGDGRCGFEFERSLSTIPPGFYQPTWRIRGTSTQRPLGRLQVLPRLDLTAELRWPQVAAQDEDCWIGLDASLVASQPPEAIEVLWNGSPHAPGLEHLRAEVLERDAVGLYHCRLRGLVRARPAQDRHSQELELRFLAESGADRETELLGTWARSLPLHLGKRVSHRFTIRRLSPLDPTTGLADVEIVGWLQGEDIAELELLAGGTPLATLPLDDRGADGVAGDPPSHRAQTPTGPGSMDSGSRGSDSGGSDSRAPEPPGTWRHFSLHQRLPLEPGECVFRLEASSRDVQRGGARRDDKPPREESRAEDCPDGQSVEHSSDAGPTPGRRLVQSWTEEIRPATPSIEVDHLRVRSPEGRRSEHLIFLSGWIEHHTAIEDLRLIARLESGESRFIGAVPIDASRHDVAAFRGDPLIRRQGFHIELPADVDAGAHELCLEASWLGQREILWRRSAAFEPPVAQNFLIESEALEALEQRRLGPLRAAIRIEGTVSSKLGEVTATMFVDGHMVDRQSVADGQSFQLRYRPPNSGTWPLRILFESFGRTLYDSGSVPVACELLDIAPRIPAALDAFLTQHDIEGRLGLPAGADISSLLLESHGEDLDAYEAMLGDIGRVLEIAERNPFDESKSAAIPAPRPGRPLRVLVASWEVPCRRHGGGVYLSDLLQRLGSRHEITLVHGHGPGEEAWIEELRPHLHRVLSVPRQGQELPGWAFEPSIRSVCSEYVPELRSTIESEVFSGHYDVVDYCYRWMLPHASRANVPQILTLLEDPFAARLSEALAGTVDDEAKLKRLDRLLLAFHFTACIVPRRFRFMTTVNATDARWIRPLATDRVRVNGIGVDLERFSAEGREVPERPRFVFVGNYRHPPSVDAARFAAEEVLPRLRRRIPGAELSIVGAHPTAELKELGQRDGVTVTGFVDDVRDWLRSATAFIAPIFTGAGTRVKVLEAMASGTPVVGSPLAFLGIGGEPGEHYLQAETVGQFADACQQLAADRERADAISKAARHWVEAQHSLDVRAREREELWFQAARGARALPVVEGGR